MSDLKVCRICLRTEAKVYHFSQYQLKFYYEEVMALQLKEQDGLPQYFCYECATILHKFHKFKEKCFRGQKVLRDTLWRGPLTYEAIYKIDRNQTMLKSPVTLVTYSDRIRTYTVKDTLETAEIYVPEKKIEKIEDISLDYFSENSITDQDQIIDFDEEKIMEHIQVSFREEKIKIDNENADMEPYSPTTVYVEGEKGIMKIKCEEIKERKNGNRDKCSGSKSVLDSNHWKRFTLNEEEALKNFRARAEDKKYVNAAYKCTDCFKGFSKKNMLDRHIQLRHVEVLGPYECRFCHMRYRLDCYLRKHMAQHYTKFECLRCHRICPLENSAILHDEYHSGITRKCDYCDEEFRHSSTYYTHLRTHRSEHVCTLCGASFVSKLGLHQHKRVKHIINDIDSPDDDEEVNTYCERCDIRFETRKAYEEHLFQSALHTEVESNYAQEKNRKLLSKKEREKITKELRKRSSDEELLKAVKSVTKRRKFRRKHTKPTTCHQCGKHFETQKACQKHHLLEHPRTSFYAPNERYICEICGSSLAPGSIKTHQNMHTREKLHTCDTCGRQFHATVGLKRHLLTHTGEKPFACSLCDKRFTQSNSMKLHYRTFHLKEPYPKRNRRKNKEEPKTADAEESNSEDESDSSLADMEADLPEHGGLKPTPDALPDNTNEENMHYLTLT